MGKYATGVRSQCCADKVRIYGLFQFRYLDKSTKIRLDAVVNWNGTPVLMDIQVTTTTNAYFNSV